MDVSALLWTIDWPINGTVDTFISGFKIWLTRQLVGADIHLCFDRYRDYSTKSTTSSAGAATTRIHQLQLRTPLPARDAVLRDSANKAQLNSLICEHILIDDQFLHAVTRCHKLVVSCDESVPTQVSRGRKMPRLDLNSTHNNNTTSNTPGKGK